MIPRRLHSFDTCTCKIYATNSDIPRHCSNAKSAAGPGLGYLYASFDGAWDAHLVVASDVHELQKLVSHHTIIEALNGEPLCIGDRDAPEIPVWFVGTQHVLACSEATQPLYQADPSGSRCTVRLLASLPLPLLRCASSSGWASKTVTSAGMRRCAATERKLDAKSRVWISIAVYTGFAPSSFRISYHLASMSCHPRRCRD